MPSTVFLSTKILFLILDNLSIMATLLPTHGIAADIRASDSPSSPSDPKRLRWWIFSCIAFVIIAPTVSTIIGLKVHAGDLEYYGAKDTGFSGRTVCTKSSVPSILLLRVFRLDLIRSCPYCSWPEGRNHDHGLDDRRRKELTLLKGQSACMHGCQHILWQVRIVCC